MPTAFVFVTTDPASMSEVLRRVRAVGGVDEAGMVYGVFDIVVKVTADTMEQLKQVVTLRLRRLPGVLTTNTLLVVPPE